MEQKKHLFELLQEICANDKRYELEAYNFVLLALNYTMGKHERPRHVSGRELMEGIREYALDQFGPLVRTVFEHWGIHTSDDFGEIVFNLVNNGLLGKSENDSKDDFHNVFDFEEVFDNPFKAN
ncbi:MAG: Minf_1886 family protein [Candidatus Auribacterota bacterium]|jgi:uncharacterized repeat protein (TIGR04138 family)|uniref:Uncharacterized protein n=1 Tax=Candidatus Auribacter fodinae TaxID=2093366 RepID=A0A3A4RA60_9BACT|nr:MAG: hypothetical protein C4541_08115 [Candidatus Auribacter fodinae]